jgi:hypothetical protein
MNSLILVCAIGLAHADCSTETADLVVQGPDVPHLAACGLQGQAYLADTALAAYLDGEHYLKIACGTRPQPERAQAPSQLAQLGPRTAVIR